MSRCSTRIVMRTLCAKMSQRQTALVYLLRKILSQGDFLIHRGCKSHIHHPTNKTNSITDAALVTLTVSVNSLILQQIVTAKRQISHFFNFPTNCSLNLLPELLSVLLYI